MTRFTSAVILAVAAWLSGAVFTPVSASPGAAWLVALPPLALLAAAAAVSALLVAWRPPASLFALLPLVAVLLPWIPGVDAGLITPGRSCSWSGPASWPSGGARASWHRFDGAHG